MRPGMYAKVVQFSDHKEDGNMFQVNCILEILVFLDFQINWELEVHC